MIKKLFLLFFILIICSTNVSAEDTITINEFSRTASFAGCYVHSLQYDQCYGKYTFDIYNTNDCIITGYLNYDPEDYYSRGRGETNLLQFPIKKGNNHYSLNYNGIFKIGAYTPYVKFNMHDGYNYNFEYCTLGWN